DSLGYAEIVQADAVQIMSAGSGIRHEEHNVGNDEVHFLQIWIEPKIANIQPRYQRRNFPKKERTNQLTTIVSNEEGVKHCWINQNARISLGYFTEKTNQTYLFKNTENSCAYVFIISGCLSISNIVLNERDGAGFWETEKLNFLIEPNTEFIVIEVPINH
ncbi:MAG: pirin family protein, partial [Chitinophagaceae bacterium]